MVIVSIDIVIINLVTFKEQERIKLRGDVRGLLIPKTVFDIYPLSPNTALEEAPFSFAVSG